MCTSDQGLRTVAYAFMTRGAFPLWPIWQAYWRSCTMGAIGVVSTKDVAGSAVPLFHAQDVSSHETLRRMTAEFHGYVLPPNETVQGNPRYNWKMVAMMLHLFRAVPRLRAPNGCMPKWVHLASERDAPVVAW